MMIQPLRVRIRFLVIACALISLVSIVGCASMGTNLEPPDVSLVDIKPLPSAGNFEQRMGITLRVSNPNETPLDFDGVDVVLDLNGRRLGRAMGTDRITIPRLSDALVELVATTSMWSLLRQAIEWPGEQQLSYKLKGRIFMANGPGSLRFTRDGQLLDLARPSGARSGSR